MSKIYLLLSVVLMLQASRACDGQNEEEQLVAARQQSDEYFANAYGFNPNPWGSAYYQPSARVPGNLKIVVTKCNKTKQVDFPIFKDL
jgi:hypothetical protein